MRKIFVRRRRPVACESLECRRLLSAPEVELYAWQPINSAAESNHSQSPYSGSPMGVMVTINNSANSVPKTVTISWGFTAGSADASDYNPVPFSSWTATIPARAVWAGIGPSLQHPELAGYSFFGQVYTKADNLVEGSETFTGDFHLTGGKFYGGSQNWSCQYVINDSPPVVGFTTPAVGEILECPGLPTDISLNRTGGDLDAALPVALSFSGTAIRDEDYELSGVDAGSDQVTFAAGQTSATFTVVSMEDAITETEAPPATAVSEPLDIQIAALGDSYTVASNRQRIQGTIDDDSAYYYTPWRLVGVPNPLIPPVVSLGTYSDGSPTSPKWGDPDEEYSVGEPYFYYKTTTIYARDEYVPQYSILDLSADYGLRVTGNVSMSFLESTSSTWALTVSTYGLGLTLYSTTTTTGGSLTINKPYDLQVDADQYGAVIPLLQRRTVFVTTVTYVRTPSSDSYEVANGGHGIVTSEYVGWTGVIGYAHFLHDRAWTDEEAAVTEGRTPAPPSNAPSVFQGLLDACPSP